MSVNMQHELMDRKEEFFDGRETFGNLNDGMFGDGVNSCSTSPLEGELAVDPDTCGMCG